MQYCGNVWVKMINLARAGDTDQGHSHRFDHTTLLARGRVEVEVDGVSTMFAAPSLVYIQAGRRHRITALEDDVVVVCIHAVRDGDGVEDIVAEDAVPLGVQHPQMKPLVAA